jgi:hypothetical protein
MLPLGKIAENDYRHGLAPAAEAPMNFDGEQHAQD